MWTHCIVVAFIHRREFYFPQHLKHVKLPLAGKSIQLFNFTESLKQMYLSVYLWDFLKSVSYIKKRVASFIWNEMWKWFWPWATWLTTKSSSWERALLLLQLLLQWRGWVHQFHAGDPCRLSVPQKPSVTSDQEVVGKGMFVISTDGVTQHRYKKQISFSPLWYTPKNVSCSTITTKSHNLKSVQNVLSNDNELLHQLFKVCTRVWEYYCTSINLSEIWWIASSDVTWLGLKTTSSKIRGCEDGKKTDFCRSSSLLEANGSLAASSVTWAELWVM